MDTATADTVVAVLRADGGSLEGRVPPQSARPRHSSSLLATAVKEMAGCNVTWGDIERIAIGVGPGTFTGLRIGIATALGLARARDIPLVGVSTLRSLASAAVRDAPRAPGAADADAVVAAIDARRGEVFAAGWDARDVADPAARPWLAPAPMPPETLAERLRESGRRCLVVGSGAVEFRASLEPVGALVPHDGSERHRVSATEHCRWALRLPSQDPADIRPDYLRLPDAEITLRAASQR
jgi:tRNA threonylcarbamoyl adenosine modification protein YeaZ